MWKKVGYFFHGDATGKFSCLGATHAVTYRKDIIVFVELGFPDLAQVLDLESVQRKGEEGVFIALAESACIRESPPLDVMDLVFMVFSSHAFSRRRERCRGWDVR